MQTLCMQLYECLMDTQFNVTSPQCVKFSGCNLTFIVTLNRAHVIALLLHKIRNLTL